MSRKDFDLNMDDKQMKTLMKRAKRKQLFRNFVISIFASTLVIVGSFTLIVYLKQKNFNEMEKRVFAEQTVTGPNIKFYSHRKLNMGLMSDSIMYSSYKNISGQPVKWIDEIYEYDVWGYMSRSHNGNTHLEEELSNIDEAETLQDYNIQTMQREMRFYLPFMKYVNYANDLNQIGDLKNKVAEVALSFDKAYTMDEIMRILPKGVQPVWFWVDTYNEKKRDEYVGLTDPKTGAVLNAEKSTLVYGFTGSYAKKEEEMKMDFERHSKEFMGAMKTLAEDERHMDNAKDSYKEIKNTKPKDLPIYGVVVTGKIEDLQSLQGAPYIKAAVRGVTVEKY
ncbi:MULTISPECIES: anti sigma factor C-terminal domain-containing protein [Bacillus cereus group]|uniref:anti sigma factor C-terminal domain-containing protein n=1 Tax=Bacillus cereus group TaxID=86661 RepID=UPI001F572B46|nr:MULTISPECIES: anti sigma factor C-terminal domain-containing protein [Bacillus cereus group]MED0968694.1 anti sigma factor C-terminal domain-containing protein [Bacillus paramycoides]MED0979520.1 anti sigma factor C-terminal domain-containing protein [Bacillus paramycoides]MED1089886.1 anti sigma factor C-terminal domain-containing protein [Bacillus paramycoides]MED1106492.1 anti sigma factor C-terminal domain-containing protein [Bacillus paramycoides]